MMKIIKNNYLKIFLIIIFIGIVAFWIYNSTYNINNIPTGKFVREIVSPDEKHSMKSYLYSGGATMAWTLRVEIFNNDTLEKWNIYWKYKQYEDDMKWIDNDTVEINKIKLNIYKDKYDWRTK